MLSEFQSDSNQLHQQLSRQRSFSVLIDQNENEESQNSDDDENDQLNSDFESNPENGNESDGLEDMNQPGCFDILIDKVENCFWQLNKRLMEKMFLVSKSIAINSWFYIWEIFNISILAFLGNYFKDLSSKDDLSSENNFLLFSSACTVVGLIVILCLKEYLIIKSKPEATLMKFSRYALIVRFTLIIVFQLALLVYLHHFLGIIQKSFYLYDKYLNVICFLLILTFGSEPAILLEIYLLFCIVCSAFGILWLIFISLYGLYKGIVDGIKGDDAQERRENSEELQKINQRVEDNRQFYALQKMYKKETFYHDSCIICLLEFEEDSPIIQLGCSPSHIFHQDCIQKWWANKGRICPICRTEHKLIQNIEY